MDEGQVEGRRGEEDNLEEVEIQDRSSEERPGGSEALAKDQSRDSELGSVRRAIFRGDGVVPNRFRGRGKSFERSEEEAEHNQGRRSETNS